MGKIGFHPSIESKNKNRDSHIGKHHSEEAKKKVSDFQKGKPKSEEMKKKLSEFRKTFRHTEATKLKIKEKRALQICSEETRTKLRNHFSGEGNPNWRGGIDNNPYPSDWTETLRRSIRERDNYTCKICSKQQGDIVLHIHHIDYNKENCNPTNLITLCHSCHNKTSFNRDYWIKYFGEKNGR